MPFGIGAQVAKCESRSIPLEKPRIMRGTIPWARGAAPRRFMAGHGLSILDLVYVAHAQVRTLCSGFLFFDNLGFVFAIIKTIICRIVELYLILQRPSRT